MFFVVNSITIGTLLLSIIYTAGVVWRVEKELDISYKFFLVAILFLATAEIVNLYPAEDSSSLDLIVRALRMLFTLCFLSGVLLMRDIVRKIDGEKKNTLTKKKKN